MPRTGRIGKGRHRSQQTFVISAQAGIHAAVKPDALAAPSLVAACLGVFRLRLDGSPLAWG